LLKESSARRPASPTVFISHNSRGGDGRTPNRNSTAVIRSKSRRRSRIGAPVRASEH
jgi:hypothetical protein